MNSKQQSENVTSLDQPQEQYFTIMSSDHVSFENIPANICMLSNVLKSAIANNELKDNGNIIPVPDVGSAILAKIIEWMTHHVNNPPQKIEKPLKSNDLSTIVSDWDNKFIDIDVNTLFVLMNGTNFMDIPDLLDLCCAKLATIIKGKSAEEIRNKLGIENDFTPEEEEEMKDKLPI